MLKQTKIVVEIYHIDDDELPPDARYIAQINEGEYSKTLVTADSVPNLFKELSTSMWVLDEFNKYKNDLATK